MPRDNARKGSVALSLHLNERILRFHPLCIQDCSLIRPFEAPEAVAVLLLFLEDSVRFLGNFIRVFIRELKVDVMTIQEAKVISKCISAKRVYLLYATCTDENLFTTFTVFFQEMEQFECRAAIENPAQIHIGTVCFSTKRNPEVGCHDASFLP
jgi:hypothetical protein